jgi:hypothetical protein
MTANEILSIAVPALITTVLVPFIASMISVLTTWIKAKTSNAMVDKYINLAGDAVNTAVAEVMQTFVSTMKTAGTWDSEAAAKAFNMAKKRAIQIMGAAALDALPAIVGDTEAWLKANIEAATYAKKMW